MNITYLIGAGASANVIPVVNMIPNKIEEIVTLLSTRPEFQLSEFRQFDDLKDRSMRDHQQLLINDLKVFLNQLKTTENTVDEIALKKRYNNEEFVKIKALLTVILIWCQLGNKIDRRYDRWIAAHINSRTNKLPDNITVLSWNYDHQFETAFADYSNENNLDENKKHLNVVTRHSSGKIESGFALYKLNGTASAIDANSQQEFEIFKHFQSPLDIKSVEELVHHYARMKSWNPNNFSLSYGWQDHNQKFLSNLQRSVQNTEILIVIGYSFPPNNTEIDRLILNQMRLLRKIYVQDLNYHSVIPRIKATMELYDEIGIEGLNDVSKFMNVNDAP